MKFKFYSTKKYCISKDISTKNMPKISADKLPQKKSTKYIDLEKHLPKNSEENAYQTSEEKL